jgi:hypothetical protein
MFYIYSFQSDQTDLEALQDSKPDSVTLPELCD